MVESVWYLSLAIVVVLILWPSLMLQALLVRPGAADAGVSRIRGVSMFLAAVVMSVAVFASACLASMLPTWWEQRPAPALPQHVWSIESAELNGDRLTVRVALSSHRSEPYWILDRGGTLTIERARTFVWDKPSGDVFHSSLAATVVAWSDLGKPVLEIGTGMSKWVIVEGVVDAETARRLQESRNGDLSIELHLKGFRNGDHISVRGRW